MTHDAEAAWPLTATEPGYYGAPAATGTPPSRPASPLYSTANISSLQAPLVTQPATPAPLPYHRATAAFSPGQRIAMLAVVLALSVPLTAIVLVFTDSNLVALGGVWLGIILITAIITGLGDKKTS